MADMFKCDLSGKVEEGRGALNFSVPISDKFKFTIVPHVSKNGRDFSNGVVGQDVINTATKVLQDKFGKPTEDDASKPVLR